MGPITIFDKSALQALSMDESVWFDAFFLANVIPIFYVETLADLEKDMALSGRSPEDLVGMFAEKTPSGAFPNAHHRQLIIGELLGYEVEMTGRVVISAGERMVDQGGQVGLHVEFAEEAALRRRIDHEFLEIERETAKLWRDELAAHDPERLIGVLKNVLPADAKISALEHLKGFIDSFCTTDDPHVFELMLDVLGDDVGRAALARWEAAGRPSFDVFAPYSTHVFKVDLLYYLGMHRGFISAERASNRVDMAYLYYLPFAMVFASGDGLHHRTAPLFLRPDQSYVKAQDLKDALAELDQHYDALPDEIKDLGVMRIASYPPTELDNLVAQLWDKHMRPGWRGNAEAREAEHDQPRDPTAVRETIRELQEQIAGAKPTGEEASRSHTETDYGIIKRKVAVQRGKWRILPKGIEGAGDGETQSPQH